MGPLKREGQGLGQGRTTSFVRGPYRALICVHGPNFRSKMLIQNSEIGLHGPEVARGP